MTNKYDIVIVGSGLGGLACGSILSQYGYKVCVLEKHYQIGGCLQDFKRNGVRFETGMHYLGSYDDGQILNSLFKFFDVYNKVDVEKLNDDGFDVLQINGKEYKVPQGIHAYKKYLKQQFPNEISGIDAYFEKIIGIYNAVDMLNLREISAETMATRPSIDENVYEFVSGITQNKDLQNLLCLLNSLYGASKHNASLYIHAIINMFYLQGAWKFTNGGGQLAQAFQTVIEQNGGKVYASKEVVSFVSENNKVNSVRLKDGSDIFADKFISNFDPLATLKMVEGGNFRKVLLNRLSKLEQTVSCFSLYIVLKPKTIPYINANYYRYQKDDVWAVDSYDADAWPQAYMLYYTQSKKNPEYAESLTLLSPMKFSDMKPWENTIIGKRGADYEQMKEQKSEKLIELLKEEYPDIENCIEKTYSATPLTIRDYTGVRDGAMYGVLVDSNAPYDSQLLPKTRMDNLYLTGQNVNIHGILGVSISAVLTCGEIVGTNRIIKDIRNKR